MSVEAHLQKGEFVLRAEDVESPADLFRQIQAAVLDAWVLEEAKKDAQLWGFPFVHRDLDGRWWIAQPDGSLVEHFQDDDAISDDD